MRPAKDWLPTRASSSGTVESPGIVPTYATRLSTAVTTAPASATRSTNTELEGSVSDRWKLTAAARVGPESRSEPTTAVATLSTSGRMATASGCCRTNASVSDRPSTALTAGSRRTSSTPDANRSATRSVRLT